MVKENEQAYLPPKDQLEIAAKVNRICELEPGEFTPEQHLEDVKIIVRALDSRLKPGRTTRFKLSKPKSSDSVIISGATNAGNVSTTFQNEAVKKFLLGVKEYRIGSYVARKIKSRRNMSTFIFEHFWDRGENNEAFETFPTITGVTYNPANQDVKRVFKGYPKTRFLGDLCFITYRQVSLWKA